jgi:hypothetical protein
MATLVRHAQTVLDPATPSDEWPLSDEGDDGLAIAINAGLSFDEWRAMPFPAVIEC